MIDIGVGLWNMRSTAAHPVSIPVAYQRLQRDARAAEALGFHSLWLAEHHFWYDGWCPSPLTAAGAVLGATSRLGAGTGVHILSVWEPDVAGSAVGALIRMSGGRFELGVGLGYRDEEFDGFGLARRTRGRLMDTALDRLQARWERPGTGPPIMVGGFSDAALRRAAVRGLGIFLPFSMDLERLRRTIGRYQEFAAGAGRAPSRIGMLKHAWVTDGRGSESRYARTAIADSSREYSGAWFPLGDQIGFNAPKRLEQQLLLATDNAFIGVPEQIAQQLGELASAGVDLVVLQVTRDDVDVEHRRQMELIGSRVLPLITRGEAGRS